MKLNRKTARARKTHSIVHLVQLRQKVHRPFFLPFAAVVVVNVDIIIVVVVVVVTR